MNPGVITQRFTAPTGFVFTGPPVYGYYDTAGGVASGDLDHEVCDDGRTLVIRANPHLNTTTSDTGILIYTIPLRALRDAQPGVVTDGSASIGTHPPVQILAKVTGAANELSAEVTQTQFAKSRVVPGQQWVYPAVLQVTNTGQHTIGTHQIVLTAPKGLRFMEDRLVASREDESAEIEFAAERSTDNRVLTCWNAELGLAAGKWLVLYPAMQVDNDAPTGRRGFYTQVELQIGNPAFATGQAELKIG
ncbi:hypothetical protein ACFYYD_16765 [Streptomyces bluensis]|uniref:hypothetical protein n=1 Tax=Streptomyces bluensis TaxID=33897 RepID=UPI0036C947A6